MVSDASSRPASGTAADRLTQGSRHKMLEIYNTVKSLQFNTADIGVRFLRLVYSMVEGIEEGR